MDEHYATEYIKKSLKAMIESYDDEKYTTYNEEDFITDVKLLQEELENGIIQRPISKTSHPKHKMKSKQDDKSWVGRGLKPHR